MTDKIKEIEQSKQISLSDLLAAVREQLKKFENDEDRLDFMNELTNGYCKYCGCYEGDYSCQCWNDD